MKTAMIIEIEAAALSSEYTPASHREYVIVSEDAYDDHVQIFVSQIPKKNRHLTLDAAKNSAYEQGYKSYIYKGKRVKFRESRDKRKYNLELS